ncbi:MAG: 50S ribosomal protein L17 [Patescibacteria group bacterium]
MRHHDRNKKLGRVKRQRKALIKGLVRSLVLSDAEGITTTEAKAKALRPFVERLITTGKKGTLASRRRLAQEFEVSGDTGKKMLELATRYAKRAGGYTRIVRLGRVGKRVGDMARIELVK